MISPQDEDALCDVIAGASDPFEVRGGGTRPVGTGPGADRAVGEVLSAAGLGGVRLYEPGALTLVAGAGTPLSEIEEVLAAEGQRLAFEPGDWRRLLGSAGTPTIGGVVAANVSGPRRVQQGAARDFLLGVRFVDGNGHLVRNGGRVMKNVTGTDLARLMAGSWGTLGVLTEVALKVLPIPERSATLVCEGLSDAEAIAALTAALGSPWEVTGAAVQAGRAMVRLEGFDGQVAYRLGQLRDLLARWGDWHEAEADWAAIRDVSPFAGRDGAVWRVTCRPSEAAALLGRADGEALVDWGGGLLWVLVPDSTDLRARLGSYDGSATRMRGRGAGPVFEPPNPQVAALSSGLRARFDPRGILNPGRMG